jgi:hypothetical protein
MGHDERTGVKILIVSATGSKGCRLGKEEKRKDYYCGCQSGFQISFFYNDFLFNVFNIIDIKNKVKGKYKRKNIKTISMLFFFATTNHKITKIISNNSLIPIEANVYQKLLFGVFDIPLKKIIIQTIIIAVKTGESIKRSDKYFSAPNSNKAMAPKPVIPQPNAIATKIFLMIKAEFTNLFLYKIFYGYINGCKYAE